MMRGFARHVILQLKCCVGVMKSFESKSTQFSLTADLLHFRRDSPYEPLSENEKNLMISQNEPEKNSTKILSKNFSKSRNSENVKNQFESKTDIMQNKKICSKQDASLTNVDKSKKMKISNQNSGSIPTKSSQRQLELCGPNSPRNSMEKEKLSREKLTLKNLESRRGDRVVGDDYITVKNVIGKNGEQNRMEQNDQHDQVEAQSIPDNSEEFENRQSNNKICQKQELMRKFWNSIQHGDFNISLKNKGISLDRVDQFIRYDGQYSTCEELEHLSFLFSSYCKNFNIVNNSRNATHETKTPLMVSETIGQYYERCNASADEPASEVNGGNDNPAWKNGKSMSKVVEKPDDSMLKKANPPTSEDRKMPFHAEIPSEFICVYHQWYGQKAKYCSGLCVWELASTMRCCPNHLQYGSSTDVCLPPCAFARHHKIVLLI